MRARDGQRKADLHQLETAFEEYYNDHRCYPPYEALQECGMPPAELENVLYPHYLKAIPCDPFTKKPYLYFYLSYGLSGDYCSGYRVLAELEIPDDPDIAAIGCSYESGCNYIFGLGYNYGVQRGWEIEEYCPDREESGACIDREWRLPDEQYNFQPTACIPQLSGGVACHHVTYQELLTKYSCPSVFGLNECNETNCFEGSPKVCSYK